jgi:hypothetical protein
VAHSGALREHGGAVLAQSAASLRGADADNGATFAALAGGTAPAVTSSVAAVPAPRHPRRCGCPRFRR